MNCQEFNEKWGAYLKEGFYGHNINIPEVTAFLDELFEELTKLPDFQYSQIKLKFGKARFYGSLSRRMNEMIEREIDRIVAEVIFHS